MSACHFAIVVLNWLNRDKIKVYGAYDILTSKFRIFKFNFFITPSRYHKLVLSRLCPLYVIVAVKEATIAHKQGHLKSLVHHAKVLLTWQLRYLDVLGVLWHHCLEVLEKLYEL